jgi:hypothetical protein
MNRDGSMALWRDIEPVLTRPAERSSNTYGVQIN